MLRGSTLSLSTPPQTAHAGGDAEPAQRRPLQVEMEMTQLGNRGPEDSDDDLDPDADAAADGGSGLLKAPPAMMMSLRPDPPELGAHGGIHSTSRLIKPGTKLYGELHFGERGYEPSCCTCLPDYARRRTFVKVYDTHVHSNLSKGPLCCCCCCPGESDAMDLGPAPFACMSEVTFHDTWERVENKFSCGCGKRQIYVKKRYCRGEDIMISCPCTCCCNWVDVLPCDCCACPLYGEVTNGTEFLTQWRAAAADYKVKHSFDGPTFLGLPADATDEAKALAGAKVGGEKARAFGHGTSEFVQMEDRFEAAVEYEDFAPCEYSCCSCLVHEDIRRRWSFQLYDSHFLRTEPGGECFFCCTHCHQATTVTETRAMFYDKLAPAAQPGCMGSCHRMLGNPVFFVERPSFLGKDLRPMMGETLKIAPCDFGHCRPFICFGKPLWASFAVDAEYSMRNGEDFLRSWQKVMNAYSDKHGISAEHRPHFELKALNNRLELAFLKFFLKMLLKAVKRS